MNDLNSKDNSTSALTLLVILALVCLFLPWGTVSGYSGGQITMTGINGRFTLLRASMPNWFTVAMGAAGIIAAILRIKRIATLPKIIPVLALLFSSIYSITGLFVLSFGDGATIGPGVLLINAVTIGGLVLIIRKS